MTLVIYDSNGTIYLEAKDYQEVPINLQGILIDIPQGKLLTQIDTSKNPAEPIFADIPKTQVELLAERVSELEASQSDQDDAIAEIAEIITEE